MAKKRKYYVVWQGHQPGVYDSWTNCQLQIKGFPGARYKSFGSLEEAQEAYGGSPDEFIQAKSRPKVPRANPLLNNKEEIIWDSIAVDAACSGNPGLLEYRGVDTANGTELFRVGPLRHGTNNVGEFLALVHGLAYLQKLGAPNKPIYSDSKIAMGWVKRKVVKTQLKQTASNRKLFELIQRGIGWLNKNSYTNPILKWETKEWGEIPADFGRK